jgi:hypothetical protein
MKQRSPPEEKSICFIRVILFRTHVLLQAWTAVGRCHFDTRTFNPAPDLPASLTSTIGLLSSLCAFVECRYFALWETVVSFQDYSSIIGSLISPERQCLWTDKEFRQNYRRSYRQLHIIFICMVNTESSHLFKEVYSRYNTEAVLILSVPESHSSIILREGARPPNSAESRILTFSVDLCLSAR